MSSNSELSSYEDFLEKLISDNDGRIFENSSSEHAAVVLKKMLEHSKQEIFLYVDNLDGAITKHRGCASEFKKYLDDKDKKLYVLVDNGAKFDSTISQIFKKAQNSKNFKIREAHPAFIEEMSEDAGLRYFVIADDKMYRCQADSDLYKAFCSFNDVKQTTLLKEIFYSFWAISETLYFN